MTAALLLLALAAPDPNWPPADLGAPRAVTRRPLPKGTAAAKAKAAKKKPAPKPKAKPRKRRYVPSDSLPRRSFVPMFRGGGFGGGGC